MTRNVHTTTRNTIRSLLLTGICMPVIGFAADESSARDDSLEEVVVTATKRSEPLLNIPLSVSAISGKDIQARGYSQFADYLDSIPGVYFQDTGPGTSNLHIRGATDAGFGSTVATYFGETLTSVVANHGGKPNLRLVDIDRIEVLRGPQGTLFGANSLVGVVRIIPAAPDPTRFGVNLETRGFSTAHSNDGSYHVGGSINIPLIDNKLAVRLVGYKDDIAGFIDNRVPDQPAVDYGAVFGLPPGLAVTPAIAGFTRKDVNDENTWGTRAALLWKPTEDFRIDLSYALQNVVLGSEPQIKPIAGDYGQQRSLDFFRKGGAGERTEVATVTGTYDWSAVSLTAVTSEMQLKRFTRQDITFLAASQLGAPIPWSLEDHSRGKVFTQEVRLQSRGETPLKWTLGGFYLKQQANLSQFVPDFSCPTCLPQLLFGQDFAFNAPKAKFFVEKQKSVFGEVSYDITSQWTLGIGGRYLKESVDNRDVAADGLLNNGPTPLGPYKHGSKNEFNPSAYVRYKPVEDLTMYAQAGRGFRGTQVNGTLPSTCAADAATVGLTATAAPDTLWNYELGVKSRLAGGRFSVNADVYKQKWKGVQLPVLLDCGFGGVLNAGDIDGKGVEVEFLAQPTSQWRFNVSFAYNKNKFGSVIDATGYEKGERLPDAPEMNGSAGAQYTLNLSDEWSAFARADMVYVGNVRVRFGQGSFLMESPFTTYNARVGLQRDRLAVELFGDNLTDKRGVVGTNPPDFGYEQFITRPREVGLEVRYSF